MRLARNIGIVAVLAALVAFVPAGGDAAEGVLAALLLGFLAAIGLLGHQLYQRSLLTLSALPDSRRALLYGAVGAIALMIAGLDELTATGAGTLVWLAVLAAAGGTIFWVWREAHTY